MLVEIPVHFGDKPLLSETRFFKDATRSDVFGVRKCSNEVNPEFISRKHQAKPRQLGSETVILCLRSKSVADFDAPTEIKGIVIEPAKANDLSVRFCAHGPGSIPDLPPLTCVAGNMPTTISHRFQRQRMPHRSHIAQKIK